MTSLLTTPLHSVGTVAPPPSIRVNVPAHGAPQGYLLAMTLAAVEGRYGVPGMPSLTYSGQGGPARMHQSLWHLAREFPGVCRAADTWDVHVPSGDPGDVAAVVSVIEMALAQGLATAGFAANVNMTAPKARLRLLRRHVATEAQLAAAEADARQQARAWAARNLVALPAQQQGSQHAATLGIAGLRALSDRIGRPVAAPYRRTAVPCAMVSPECYQESRPLAQFARLQAEATLPGLMTERFPGRTLFASVARTVRQPRRMPHGQGAQVCREHGWIWVTGPLLRPATMTRPTPIEAIPTSDMGTEHVDLWAA